MSAETPQIPEAPADLSPRAADLWAQIHADYELAPAETNLLVEGLRSLDRADEARRLVDTQGLHIVDRYGGIKVNPVADYEGRCRRDFAAVIRQLGIREVEHTGSRGPAPHTATRR